MNLKKIDINEVATIISRLIDKSVILKNYKLNNTNERRIITPTIFQQYDFVFTSVENDRWLLIRIEDYYKNQRIVMWINFLKTPRPVNIDVETYFIEKLDKRSLKQEFSLNLKNSNIEKKLDSFFTFFLKNSDDLLIEIVEGKKWIDMDFDWQGYK